MSKLLKEHFKNFSSSNRMGHAFLICNTNYDNLRDELSEILSDYFFDCNVDIDNSSDIILIKPENNKILKESILQLQSAFKTKSYINKNRVYILDGVEFMNEYAANSLLKFLEEPQEDIYAFLITSNLDKVLPTIKSRCMILMVNSLNDFSLNIYDEEIIRKSILVIKLFEKYSIDSIGYVYEVLGKKIDREVIKQLIIIIKYFYYDSLLNTLNKDIKYFEKFVEDINFVSLKNKEVNLIEKLIILNKYENMLEYNLNINLFIDRLIIEMGMLKND